MMLKGQIRLEKDLNEVDKLGTLGIAAIQNILEEGKTVIDVKYHTVEKFGKVELLISYK